MNDLGDAFNEINAFDFLLEELQEAVNVGDLQRITDTTAALNAFYVPFVDNWERKYRTAWDHVAAKFS